jgi:predicted ATP-grasp superfamily ATP-dependent carboligase
VVLLADILQYVDPLSAVLIVAVYRLLKVQHRELQKDVAEIRNRLRRLEERHMTENYQFQTDDD